MTRLAKLMRRIKTASETEFSSCHCPELAQVACISLPSGTSNPVGGWVFSGVFFANLANCIERRSRRLLTLWVSRMHHWSLHNTFPTPRNIDLAFTSRIGPALTISDNLSFLEPYTLFEVIIYPASIKLEEESNVRFLNQKPLPGICMAPRARSGTSSYP